METICTYSCCIYVYIHDHPIFVGYTPIRKVAKSGEVPNVYITSETWVSEEEVTVNLTQTEVQFLCYQILMLIAFGRKALENNFSFML